LVGKVPGRLEENAETVNTKDQSKSFSLMRPWDLSWPPCRLQYGHAIEPPRRLAFSGVTLSSNLNPQPGF
jgi:hypothetical protein